MIKVKLLIVDDEELIRNVIKEYAKLENYEVDEAEDGDAAIEKALSKDYDVIVMDIMMPKRDGFSAIREIKKINTNNNDVEVIFHNGSSFVVQPCNDESADKASACRNSWHRSLPEFPVRPFSHLFLPLRCPE